MWKFRQAAGKTIAINLRFKIYSNLKFSEHNSTVSQILEIMFVAPKTNPMPNCFVTTDEAIPFP
jgi:hypothetical protein